MFFFSRKNAFTLIEILVFLAIAAILFSIAVFVLVSFRKESELDEVVERGLVTLETARSKTVASEDGSQYGVYFEDTSTPHQIILFKGPDYSTRDPAYDEAYSFPANIELVNVSLSGGSQVVFQKITGETSNWGSVSMRSLRQPGTVKSLYIKGSGQIDLRDSPAPSDADRVKDSRHVHFDYTRFVDTATEVMTLTFSYNGSTHEETIPMNAYMHAGQFYWEGRVEVDGSSQELVIQTQRLNDPDTEFCIHRDRRYNDKALSISLSGDSSGPVISYSADGLSTDSVSIYVNEIIWE